MINGIINVYKEAGYTSHDVVARMRGICGQKKIGHTGTLDPQAVGVLPVCLGSGTRLCDLLTDRDKEYVAQLLLGVTTDTQDTTGSVLSREQVDAQRCPEEAIRRAVLGFVGEYDQVPPMYSALKVNGRKLCDLARAGKVVERKPRRVRIREIEIREISLPVVTLRVSCSKGTYIRTLCADIGERLGCGGTMQSLVRTRSGSFCLEDAVSLSELQRRKEQGTLAEVVIPVERMFDDCPALCVKAEAERLLENGNPIPSACTETGERFPPGNRVRFYRPDGSFAGIYAYSGERDLYLPVKMFLER